MASKITPTERMLNLVIALLGTSRGRSRHYIRANVSGYTPEASTATQELTAGAAFERMFERDKEMLRELGVPISVEASFDDDFQEQSLYRIRPEDYRVPEVRLDESSMTVLAVAASLWNGAAFSDAATSALRKVASRAGVPWTPNPQSAAVRIQTLETSFEPLWTALRDSKEVSFDYFGAGAKGITRRLVQPWGMGSKYGEWYLVAFDVERNAPRSFRLSRIRSDVLISPRSFYERQKNFSIIQFLDELGVEAPRQAVVEVSRNSLHSLRNRPGATLLSGYSRRQAEQSSDFLSIPYREAELMANELAAFGPHITVHEPASLQDAVVRKISAALSTQQNAIVDTKASTLPVGVVVEMRPKKRKDNRDRLIRLLSMVPFLVANPGVRIERMALEFGIDQKELSADLATLMVSGLPGYQHGQLMDVTNEHGQVFIRDAETLAAPLRLSQEEACALLVGLEAIRVLPGSLMEESWIVARDQLRRVAGPDSWLAEAVSLQLVDPVQMAKVDHFQHLIQEALSAQISYVVRSRDEVTLRVIEPRRLFSLDSTWYVRAWCQQALGFRSFRLDQILSMHDAGSQDSSDLVDHEQTTISLWDNDASWNFELLAETEVARELAYCYGATVYELPGHKWAGRRRVRISLRDEDAVASLLSRLGGRAFLVADSSQQHAVVAWFEAGLANYTQLRHQTESHRGTGI